MKIIKDMWLMTLHILIERAWIVRLAKGIILSVWTVQQVLKRFVRKRRDFAEAKWAAQMHRHDEASPSDTMFFP